MEEEGCGYEWKNEKRQCRRVLIALISLREQRLDDEESKEEELTTKKKPLRTALGMQFIRYLCGLLFSLDPSINYNDDEP